MGLCNSTPKLSKAEVARLVELTNSKFTADEVRRLHYKFHKENPSGYITPTDFQIINEELHLKDNFFTDRLYSVLDVENKGSVVGYPVQTLALAICRPGYF